MKCSSIPHTYTANMHPILLRYIEKFIILLALITCLN